MNLKDCDSFFRLISSLSNSEWRSGQSVADELGISRAAVWKRIGTLSEFGIEVARSRRLGYRLIRNIEPLDRSQIEQRLNDLAPELPEVRIVGATVSTNTQLLSQLRSGEAVTPCVLLAEMQTAGRGRRGRTWVSPIARNIYLSYGWRCDRGAAGLSGLSLAVGAILADVIGQFVGAPVQLKWPNDLLIQSRKFGGVLIDIDGDLEGAVNVVIGVGINIQMGGSDVVPIEQPWADLDAYAVSPISRNEIAARMIAALSSGLAQFSQSGFSGFRDAWMARDAFAGKEVRISAQCHALSGREIGVSDNGGLLIQTGEDIIEVNSGDVSLRAL